MSLEDTSSRVQAVMEFMQEEEVLEPVSPNGQYFNSSVLSVSILGILELEVPIDGLQTMSLLQNVFLPINPRFSSIMVRDKDGVKQWKKVEVKLNDHVNVPVFPAGMSPESYDEYFDDYISKIAMDQLPQSRPLWELHLIKYPTRNAAGNLIFKLHHALGDGYSLMGALLSCLQRADNPSLPLTFPSFQLKSKSDGVNRSIFGSVPRVLSAVFNTISDFGWSFVKSSLVQDDRTPIRSGDAGVEFRSITISTIAFSLDQIKQIKANLKVTINDVITGIIFFGTRLYMQAASHGFSNSHSTSLVLLNTRNIGGYKSIKEMVQPGPDPLWGNQFAFLHVPIPELADASNPLDFVRKAQQIIKKKRSSSAVYLTGKLLETVRKFRGPETSSRYIHSTLKNSSMAISNMIGPVEQMALANHPVKGFYFMVVGSPQSLMITVMSYMGKLRIGLGMEKGFTDPHKFKLCVENAFEMIFNASCKSPSQVN